MKTFFSRLLDLQSSAPGLSYACFAWVLALLLTLLSKPFYQPRGPIEVHFNPRDFITLQVHVEEYSDSKVISLMPDSLASTPQYIYGAKIKKISATVEKLAERNIKLCKSWRDECLEIPLIIDNKQLESADLDFENTPIGKALVSGIYLGWVLVLSALYFLVLAIRNRRVWKSEFLFAGILSIPLLYLIQLHWPGHFSWDSLQDYQLALAERHNSYTQVLYSTLQMTWVLFVGSMACNTIFNCVLFLFFLTFVYHITRQNMRAYVAFLFALLLIFGAKMNQQMLLLQNRDILFSIVFVMYLGFLAYPGSRWSARIFFFLVAAALRKETLFLFPLFIFLEVLLSKDQLRIVLRRFILPSMALLTYYCGSGYLRDIHFDSNYLVTGVINPMMHIVVKRGKDVLSDDERKKLEGVLDLDKAIKDHNPNDINAMHGGAYNWKNPDPPQSVRRIKNITSRLIREYPFDFLENRLQISQGVLGLSPNTYWFNNEAFHNPMFRMLAKTLPTTVQSDGNSAWAVANSAIELGWYRVLLASAVPAILLILASFLFWKRYPRTAAANLIVLTRTAVVLLLAPATYYKYVWCISIWGPLVPVFALVEMNYLRQRKGKIPKT